MRNVVWVSVLVIIWHLTDSSAFAAGKVRSRVTVTGARRTIQRDGPVVKRTREGIFGYKSASTVNRKTGRVTAKLIGFR
jgi:hypothetical protein